MTNPSIIPTNFRVPKDFRHEWLLFHEDEFISAMTGVPGRKQVRHFARDPSNCPDDRRKLVFSRTLDWMQESVEHLRYLCEQE